MHPWHGGGAIRKYSRMSVSFGKAGWVALPKAKGYERYILNFTLAY